MPSPDQLALIAIDGYQMIINLALNESPGAILDEAELVSHLGMRFVHIPVIWESPQIEDFKKFAFAMEQAKNLKVFVHCVLNMRVSVFVFLYRVIYKKEDPDSAYQDLLKVWEPDQIWGDFINKVLTHQLNGSP